MKNRSLFLLALMLFSSQLAQAQQGCQPGSNISYLETENLLAKFGNGGTLFGPGPGVVNEIPNAPEGPSVVFSAALWLGAFDPAGNLKIAAGSYVGNGGTDYAVGPLNPFTGQMTDPDCQAWNRVFRVTGSQIAAHLADFFDNGVVDNPIQAIYGWPGKGNTHFYQVYFVNALALYYQQLAPFHDADGNGLYDPDKGDYPAIFLPNGTELVPDQIVWHVFNDVGLPHEESGGQPLGVEVQVTAFAFDCEEPDVLHNTFFVQHKIINRSLERLDSLQVGLFVDFDLGCYLDDYIGCKPDLNTFFVYNQDNVDGPGGGCNSVEKSFGENPPAAAVTFLNKPLDRFMYTFGYLGFCDPPIPMLGPGTPNGYYNFLNAHWSGGEPLSVGEEGYSPFGGTPTLYAFPGNPNNPDDWTMYSTALNCPQFASSLGVNQVGTLLPGQSTELVTAWSQHREAGRDHLENVSLLYDEVELVQLLYDCSFDCVCSPVSSVKNVLEVEIGIFPNPASESLTLRYGDLAVREIRLFAADGRLVKSLQNIQPEQTALNVAGLNSGIYTVRFLTEKGSLTRKIAVVR